MGIFKRLFQGGDAHRDEDHLQSVSYLPGYMEATLVCEKLQRADKTEDLMSCLTALKATERGQECLARRDFEGALKHLKQAETIFANIPEAIYLGGICKADMSAAHGGMQDYAECARYAEECIATVGNKKELIFTRGSAYMNLGTASMHLGKPDDALTNLQKAYALLSKTSNGDKYLAALQNNIKVLQSQPPPESSRRYVGAQQLDDAIATDAETCVTSAISWLAGRMDIGDLTKDERGYLVFERACNLLIEKHGISPKDAADYVQQVAKRTRSI